MKLQKKIGIVFALAVMASLFMMPNAFAYTNDDWNNLQEQLKKGGEILLDQDYTAGDEDKALEVPAGVAVTLDLNGCTINRGLANAAAVKGGNVITVKGSLIIEDSSGDGKITGGNNLDDGGGVYVDVDGTLIMNDGMITENKVKPNETSTVCYGGGVSVNNGMFVMNGGTITGNQVVADDGDDGDYDGGDDGSYGGGVAVYQSRFDMKGGTITDNQAVNDHNDDDGKESYGAGVYVVDGAFNLSGGTISDNRSASNGGGVYVGADGKFTQSGGTIVKNFNASNGGGVYVAAGGKVTQSGGKIRDNEAFDGGGVYVGEGGIYTLDGGGISKNDAVYDAAGGGVYVGGGSFTMKRGTITGNTASINEAKHRPLGGGVYVESGEFVMNAGTIIGNEAEHHDFFGIDSYGGGLYIASGVDFTMDGGTVKNNSADHGGGLYIDKDGSFTLENGTISGNEAKDGGGVCAQGDFTMNAGTISGNTANDDGGGVYEKGVFTMNDGTVSDNYANSGGGVLVEYGGHATQSGGTISGNTADYDGGGVFALGAFTMTAGTISDNYAMDGGGVFIENNGSFTLKSGTITDNKGVYDPGDTTGDSGCGGGVYVGGGTFNLSGGKIIDNIISGDDSPGDGGGVFYNGAQFNLSGNPVIANNKKGNYDNNVFIDSTDLITIADSLKNTTKIGISMASGGGVFTSGYPDKMGSADPKQHFKTDMANHGIALFKDDETPEYNGEVTLTTGVTTYTVTFKDEDGNLLKDEIVEDGEAAVPPILTKSGYVLAGWDPDISKITSDLEEVTPIWKINIDKAPVALSFTAQTYNGNVIRPVIQTIDGKTLTEGTDYKADWSDASSTATGTYTVKVTGINDYWGTSEASYRIDKAANPLAVKAKIAKIKRSKIKKKTQRLKVTKVIRFTQKGQGAMRYKLVSAKKGKKSFKKRFKINAKTGKLTVKKGLKKGTYKVKIRVRAAGNANYNASGWQTVTCRIRVK